jgi:hypothetical protein
MEDLENIKFKTIFLLILKIHKNQNLSYTYKDLASISKNIDIKFNLQTLP